jgi:hypothetical protein
MLTTRTPMLALLSISWACAGERVPMQQERGFERARDTGVEPPTTTAEDPFTPGDRIGDVLRHPAFQGYASLLLPWDDRSYDEGMRLAEIGSLLPYHSHVEPTVVVDGLNRIIDDVRAGRQVFYPFYTEEQRRGDPTRRHAGLFFFRGKPGAPFAVVSPGGGFAYVGSVHEGFPYASVISEAGYNAFVLKYRAGLGGSIATEDLAAALTFIMRNADTLGVARRNYSLWGSSAGARMAAAIGSHGAARFGGDGERHHGVHGPLGERERRAADVRRRWRERRHRSPGGHGATGRIASCGWDADGVSSLSERRARLRGWCRHERGGMARRCGALLGALPVAEGR